MNDMKMEYKKERMIIVLFHSLDNDTNVFW